MQAKKRWTRRWSLEERDKILAAYQSGMVPKALYNKYGVSTNTLHYWRRADRIPKQFRPGDKEEQISPAWVPVRFDNTQPLLENVLNNMVEIQKAIVEIKKFEEDTLQILKNLQECSKDDKKGWSLWK